MNPEEFIKQVTRAGLRVTDRQMTQFKQYFHLLVEWNQKMNLTTITEEEDVYLKHFYDSLAPVLFGELSQDSTKTLVDVGSGAGFPSIPIKILCPDIKVTIVDSLNKRLLFLAEVVRVLGLKDVQLFHDRAETFGQNENFREQFDFVSARAVARLNVLSELCLPLVKIGGAFLALKASKAREEIEESEGVISMLGGELVEEKSYQLPQTNDPRFLIRIQKRKETPRKYPRKSGIPNKKPLETRKYPGKEEKK